MIVHRPVSQLPGDDLGWLKFNAHFGMGARNAVRHEPWGALFEWGDDQIAPGTGFPLHGHQNMEIITYVREGAITHRDDLGNVGRTEAGDVQVMSAGTGIRHSEYNLESIETSIFQIWIMPSVRGGEPVWGAKPFPKGDRAGSFVALASGFESDADALRIRSQSRVLGAFLPAGAEIRYDLAPGRRGYLVPASGVVTIAGSRVEKGDGLAFAEVSGISIRADTDSELVLVDVP